MGTNVDTSKLSFPGSFKMADQTERAFQKQPTVFLNKKGSTGKSGKSKVPRYTRNVGLGFKTPREAIEGHYIDKKCPFTGNVSVRFRLSNRMLKIAPSASRVAVRTFFRRSPSIAHEHHLDLYGPTSIQKIEADALKQGLDIFVQFDHQTPLAIMGEGTAENPFLIPSRNQCRMIWLDKSGEAPGVQGLGAPFRVFWVWAEGDGNSPAGLNRCEYTGEYYKLVHWDMPELDIADNQSHGDAVC